MIQYDGTTLFHSFFVSHRKEKFINSLKLHYWWITKRSWIIVLTKILWIQIDGSYGCRGHVNSLIPVYMEKDSHICSHLFLFHIKYKCTIIIQISKFTTKVTTIVLEKTRLNATNIRKNGPLKRLTVLLLFLGMLEFRTDSDFFIILLPPLVTTFSFSSHIG